jgi:hypothetical protein
MTDAPTTRAATDWERVEADYRAGLLSLREIAAKAGNVTEGAIRKRAKRDGWSRDLAARINAKAEELVRKEAVRTEGTQSDPAYQTANPPAERLIVEANAEAIAAVRLSHRADIRRARALALKMLGELETVTGEQTIVDELRELVEQSDPEAGKAIALALAKVTSLPCRIGSMKALGDALKTLVTLEREAWGLTTDGKGGGQADPEPVAQQFSKDPIEASRVYQEMMRPRT